MVFYMCYTIAIVSAIVLGVDNFKTSKSLAALSSPVSLIGAHILFSRLVTPADSLVLDLGFYKPNRGCSGLATDTEPFSGVQLPLILVPHTNRSCWYSGLF